MTFSAKKNLIKTWIAQLAQSQGTYGRLLAAINESEEEVQDIFFKEYEDCRTCLDFVMAFEGGC